MFVSKHYRDKLWTNHERRSMQERAFQESSEYILPVRFDSTEIPGLHSTISYLDLQHKTPGGLALVICSKIGWTTSNRWWGEWSTESVVKSRFGRLEIRNVFDKGFEFSLLTINGSHNGQLEGTAHFTSYNHPFYRRKCDFQPNVCVFKLLNSHDSIQVDESEECQLFHGMRAYFNDIYKLKEDIFFRFDFICDQLSTALYKILEKELWEDFLFCFGFPYEDDDGTSEIQTARILRGGVAGCFTIHEAILIIDTTGNKFWGAFLNAGECFYFSSELSAYKVLPVEIEEWRSRFNGIPVTYLRAD